MYFNTSLSVNEDLAARAKQFRPCSFDPKPRVFKGIETDLIPYKSKSPPTPFKFLHLKINEQGLIGLFLSSPFTKKCQRGDSSELQRVIPIPNTVTLTTRILNPMAKLLVSLSIAICQRYDPSRREKHKACGLFFNSPLSWYLLERHISPRQSGLDASAWPVGRQSPHVVIFAAW